MNRNLILVIGIVLVVKRKKEYKFSWKKIASLGTLAAFNKGMSGGGYGAVVVGGQILSGVESKKAVGISLLAEGLISIIGVLIFILLIKDFPLHSSLVISLLIGGIASSPLAAYIVKKFHPKKLRFIIGVSILI